MPVETAAQRLHLNPRTVKKLWNSAVLKLGGDLFVEVPKTCEIVLANVYAVDGSQHDPLQAQSFECLIASGRLVI